MEQPPKKRRVTIGRLHVHQPAAATGLGAASAAAPGRRAQAAAGELWDLSVLPPPSVGAACLRATPRSAAAAAGQELARAAALARLRRLLHKLCADLGLQAPPQLAFERWRFGCKLAEAAKAPPRKRPLAGPVDGSDPLLPSDEAGDGGGLEADLARAGVERGAASAAAAALLAASRAEAAALGRIAQRMAGGGGGGGAQLSLTFSRHSLQLASGAAFVTLQRPAYGKLAALFRRHGPAEERPAAVAGAEADPLLEAAAAEAEAGSSGSRNAMHWRFFSLLLRYKSLHGAGFQAAAGPGVLDALRSALGVCFEAFASPLNARWSHFCSAFPDTDAPFGSHGSFFAMGGFGAGAAIECNPPFSPALLEAAAARCLALLGAAAAKGEALTVCYITPGWEELRGRAALRACPHARWELRLAAADHGYVDGVAHGAGRPDPYRASPYDSELLVLQTEAAAVRRPLQGAAGVELERAVREAFARCVPSAAALRRQGRA